MNQENDFKTNFISLLHWFPAASDQISWLSQKVDQGLYCALLCHPPLLPPVFPLLWHLAWCNFLQCVSISPEGDALKAERSQWEQTSVLVSELDGHSDLVTCVSTQGTTLVSARSVCSLWPYDLRMKGATLLSTRSVCSPWPHDLHPGNHSCVGKVSSFTFALMTSEPRWVHSPLTSWPQNQRNHSHVSQVSLFTLTLWPLPKESLLCQQGQFVCLDLMKSVTRESLKGQPDDERWWGCNGCLLFPMRWQDPAL